MSPQLLFVLFPVLLVAVAAEPFDYHSVRGRQPTTAQDGRYEGEALPMRGSSRVQGMAKFGPHWSGNAHLLWDGVVGDSMTTEVELPAAGRYRVAARLTLAPDYGVFALRLDDRELAAGVDLYDPKVAHAPLRELGVHELAAGRHTFGMRLTGANERAKKFRGKGYLLGLDYLEFNRLDPPSEPEVRPPDPRPAAAEPLDFAAFRPVLAEHCFGCHGEKKSKGKLNLEALDTRDAFLADLARVHRVSEALAFHEMPPEDEAQPEPGVRDRLVASLDAWTDEALDVANALPPVPLRRLTRLEYSNAVRDLLDLKGDIYPLPEKPIRAGRRYYDPKSGRFPDTVQAGNRALGKNQIEQHILTGVHPFAIDLPAEHGFNNRGDDLGVSPILMESFLKLGQAIVHAPEFDGYCRLTPTLFAAPAERPLETGRERLRALLTRAFRGPVNEAVARPYLAFFEAELARAPGAPAAAFPVAMKRTVAAVLASPRFLYLVERRPAEGPAVPLTAHELATRIAFLVWSSIPDTELLAAADSGELLTPEGLAAQVDRMIEDPRSQALSQNFARQWLRLDQLITAVPDFERFPAYYSRIGCEQWKLGLQSMLEPLFLFESIVVEDRSIMLLVDADHSWRSDELQSWYRDEKPFGNRGNRGRFNTNQQVFRRRSLDTRREGGVMTSAAVLTMTSSPLRTNPITRGAWILTALFNQPPPPPPDAVPEIEADEQAILAKGLTLRERLGQHASDETCAACHARIDPLGFALENYDAVGRWRDTYGSGTAIDAAGVLFGDTEFRDVVGLKDALLANPEWFQRAFAEHLLSYALGRELAVADKPAVDRILRRSLAEHGRFSVIVHAIVTSYPFRHKRAPGAPAEEHPPREAP